jgi:hypothetical protein
MMGVMCMICFSLVDLEGGVERRTYRILLGHD